MRVTLQHCSVFLLAPLRFFYKDLPVLQQVINVQRLRIQGLNSLEIAAYLIYLAALSRDDEGVILPSFDTIFRTAAKALVLGSIPPNESMNFISLSLRRRDSTANVAVCLIFLLSFTVQSRSAAGPWVTPPPFQSGERMEP